MRATPREIRDIDDAIAAILHLFFLQEPQRQGDCWSGRLHLFFLCYRIYGCRDAVFRVNSAMIQ